MKVWTDGSCIGNPGPGAWAVVFEHSEYYDYDPDTTSNRMELQAIIEAVKHCNYLNPLTIYTDSMWCINILTGNWRAKSNLDLIKEYMIAVDGVCHNPIFIWVRGHSGDTKNERADSLAHACAKGYLIPKVV